MAMKPSNNWEPDVLRLSLHESICRCPKCKGTIDKRKLCPTCAKKDAAIDTIDETLSIGNRYSETRHVAGAVRNLYYSRPAMQPGRRYLTTSRSGVKRAEA